MSTSGTANVNDSGKTSDIQSENNPKLNGEKMAQANGNEAESQNTQKESLNIALPVLTESPKVTAQPDIKSEQPKLVLANRPTDSTNLQVRQTVNPPRSRPIGSSKLQVVQTVNLSGARPIAASNLHISETILMSGNRPVASNDLEINQDLMAYLD